MSTMPLVKERSIFAWKQSQKTLTRSKSTIDNSKKV